MVSAAPVRSHTARSRTRAVAPFTQQLEHALDSHAGGAQSATVAAGRCRSLTEQGIPPGPEIKALFYSNQRYDLMARRRPVPRPSGSAAGASGGIMGRVSMGDDRRGRGPGGPLPPWVRAPARKPAGAGCGGESCGDRVGVDGDGDPHRRRGRRHNSIAPNLFAGSRDASRALPAT